MRSRCDDFYFNNYARWYSTEPFKSANAQIPQLNIWDDHDIIDGKIPSERRPLYSIANPRVGFGSYTHHFMQCSVFRGIGGVAHKYYLLFQHHIPPPPSTFTTDAPQTTHTSGKTTEPDPVQLRDTYVMVAKKGELPKWEWKFWNLHIFVGPANTNDRGSKLHHRRQPWTIRRGTQPQHLLPARQAHGIPRY